MNSAKLSDRSFLYELPIYDFWKLTYHFPDVASTQQSRKEVSENP